MSDNAFRAIINFIDELWKGFGSKGEVSQLALYHRLIQHVKFTDIASIQKFLSGFMLFFASYDESIINSSMNIPADVKIVYSDRIFLEIGKIVSHSDETTKNILRNHLLNISSILLPTDVKKTKLREIIGVSTKPSEVIEPKSLISQDGSAESRFMNGLISKAEAAAKDIDSSNPAAAITGLFSSGVFQEMLTSMQSEVEKGDIDPQKLLGSIQSLAGSSGILGGGNDMSSMLGGITSMMGGLGGSSRGTASALLESPVSTENVKDLLESRKSKKGKKK